MNGKIIFHVLSTSLHRIDAAGLFTNEKKEKNKIIFHVLSTPLHRIDAAGLLQKKTKKQNLPCTLDVLASHGRCRRVTNKKNKKNFFVLSTSLYRMDAADVLKILESQCPSM
jgi:hypothetical protein